MRSIRVLWVAVVVSALGLAAVPTTAHAYLDAGTGSMILQVIVASVAGALVALRLSWNRLKAFFRSGSAEAQASPDEPGNEGG